MAVDVTANSALLAWSTSPCSGVTDYAIYLADSSSTTDNPASQEFVANVTSQTTYYRLSNLNPGRVYYYRVRPYKADGQLNSVSRGTTVHTTPASAPGITSITAKSLSVSWSTCSGASRYYIDYRRTSSSYWMTVEVGNVRSTQITNLFPSTTYYFRVQCASASGRSPHSSTNSATTLVDPVPATPTISVSTTSVSATVSWNCSGATKYFVQHVRNDSNSLTSVEVATPPAIVWNLSPQTSYRFRVVCENMYSRRSNSGYMTVSTDSLQPTVLNVEANSTSAMVAWILPARNLTVLSRYEVLVSGGSQPQTYTVGGSGRSTFTVSDLQPETAYSFQVRTVSSSEGESPWSSPLTGVTLPLYPGEEVTVTLNETTASTISVSWTRIHFRVDWYMLTIQSVFAGNLFVVEVAVVNSTERYTFHDLLPLTDYTITVRAVNKAGSGPESTLNATTNTLAPQTTSTSTDLLISTSALATLLAILILCLSSTFVLLKCRKGHKTDSGATAQVRFSTKADEVEMEGNPAYAAVEYAKHYNDHQEDTMSLNDESVLNCPVPPRIRVDDEQCAIPTMPVQPSQISEPVYADSESFQKYSGWFMPSVNEVLSDKLGLNDEDFVKLGPGIFYMFHKTRMKAKYIGFAANLPVALCGTINNLYKKEMSSMTPIEVELKYFSPKAEDWIVQVWQCEKEVLLVERAKMIIEKQTLRPHGLNKSLKIQGKQGWEEFAEWYTHAMKTRK